eukprot:Mrub_04048.p1 GENE.Mrub_04048~~Mrub_04048.p1  ORF type:complete len:433 (+),score=44.02 Mrub_04048:2-1300(+)
MYSLDDEKNEENNNKQNNSKSTPISSTILKSNNDYEYLEDSVLDIFDSFDPNSIVNDELEYILILNIHGIQSNLKSYAGNIDKRYYDTIDSMMTQFFPKSKYRYDVRFCYWKGYAIKVLGDLLKKTNTSDDYFFKYVGMELLFYDSNPKAADLILNQLCAQMNHAYLECKQKFGCLFKGKVILHGHSLGSYLSYEILKRQNSLILYSKEKQKYDKDHCRIRLLFDVEYFYSVGAVIGLFYSLKQESIDMSHLGKCKKWFNVYYQKDPVATRVEPLMKDYNENIQPVWILPNPNKAKGREDSEKLKEFCDQVYRNMDSNYSNKTYDMHHKINLNHSKSDHSLKSKNRNTSEGTMIMLDKHQNRLNLKRKFDFQLQDSMSSYLIKPMAYFGNHFAYWSNIDFFYFMHSNLEGQPITDASNKNSGMIIGGIWYEI